LSLVSKELLFTRKFIHISLCKDEKKTVNKQETIVSQRRLWKRQRTAAQTVEEKRLERQEKIELST